MKPLYTLFFALGASLAVSSSLHADATSVSTTGVVVYTNGDGGESRVLPGMSFGSGTRFDTSSDSGANFVFEGDNAVYLGPSSSAGISVLAGDQPGAIDILFGRLAAESSGDSGIVVRTMMGNIIAAPGSKFTVSLVFDAVSECASLSITNISGSLSYAALLAGDDTTIAPGSSSTIRVFEGEPNYLTLIEGLPAGVPIVEFAQAEAFFNSGLASGSEGEMMVFAPIFTDDAALTVVSPEIGID